MWSIMINPFRLLAQQARAINAQSNPDEVQVRGVQEAVEIAEAVEGMLARIGDEQQRTRAALESARDFAAVASHELRTPLTAMRTNLEVLSTLAMRDDQRQEVIADVMRTQSRIEATLTALERLAQGELTTVDDFVPVDITELLDRAAHDAMRNYPNLRVSLASSTTVLMVGLPAGLRLVIDNAITNAIKHGGATEIRLSADSSGEGVEITVDDNGDGVPEEERSAVFERFSRGSTASRSGSGLGLALVAQQADLHGGTAAMEASPLGRCAAGVATARAELVRVADEAGDDGGQFRASLLGDEVSGAGNRCVVLVLGAGNMLLEHLLPTLGRGIAVGVGGEKRPFPLLQRGHGVPADRRARVVARQRDQRGQLTQARPCRSGPGTARHRRRARRHRADRPPRREKGSG